MIKTFLKSSCLKQTKPFIYKINYQYFNNQVPNFDPAKDYYGILDLQKNASDADIKRSYYQMAKIYHPDANKGHENKFKEISQAYSVLSNQQTKKQYDSSRLFRHQWSQMGNKAQQGSYSYQQYQTIFDNMSPEQKEQFSRQAKTRLRRVGFILGGLFVFWIFLSRTPYRHWIEYNGTLVPYNPYYQPPNQPGYNQNYGNSDPYAQQMYQQQPYGNQYPQAQYLQTPVQQYPNQYNPSQQYYAPPPQHHLHPQSQYVIDRPQPHQPYPNSGYQEKPMQSNYRSDYKQETPQGSPS